MMDPTPDVFVRGIGELVDHGAQVLITVCNSGGTQHGVHRKNGLGRACGPIQGNLRNRPGRRSVHPPQFRNPSGRAQKVSGVVLC